jgi:diguanylate cyclase (GGDEF)-like protein
LAWGAISIHATVLLPPTPANEAQRLAALRSYDVLDSESERAYDDIVELASQICGTPVALMGLVDAERVWLKARVGADEPECPREISFCSHTILQEEMLVVPDLAADSRFDDNPLVTEVGLRFYAGAPLVTPEGYAVGTLCALDSVPRELTEKQREALSSLARQVVAQLELRRLLAISRREATTDPLTELGNRRRLVYDFDALLPEATREEPLHLLLFDLDGFKKYNDTFGHSAGDALLARLARKLDEAVSGDGTVYRIGGDEFCALVRGDASRLDSVRTAASRALTEHGEGFSITASHGAVTLPLEAPTAIQALRLADERMYGHKAGRSQAACRQTHDVLIRILDERDSDLCSHRNTVARLAVEVGRRLGMTAVELDHLGKAAALHDVGKVAVPDAILKKPGALDEQEWAFMHTHTILGERILAAAPALRHEAALVRSSHERWDGDGYPDGKAGADIPLGSRIIFACDAFDAMTSLRLYRASRTHAEALAELRRCAGSQFDPIVIAVLCDEVLEPGRASLTTVA